MPNIDCWNSTKEVTNSHLSVPLCLYLELSPATTVEAGRCLGEDNPLLLYPQLPGPMLSLWAGSQAESTPTPFPNEVSQLCGKCSLLRAQTPLLHPLQPKLALRVLLNLLQKSSPHNIQKL